MRVSRYLAIALLSLAAIYFLLITIGLPAIRLESANSIVGEVKLVKKARLSQKRTEQQFVVKLINSSREIKVSVCNSGCGASTTRFRAAMLSVGRKLRVAGRWENNNKFKASEIDDATNRTTIIGTVTKIEKPAVFASGKVVQKLTIQEQLAAGLSRNKDLSICLQNCGVINPETTIQDNPLLVGANVVAVGTLESPTTFITYELSPIDSTGGVAPTSSVAPASSLPTSIGAVYFNNKSYPTVNAPIALDSFNCGDTRLAGTDYLAQLYFIPKSLFTNESSLVPVDVAPVPFRTGIAAGYVSVGDLGARNLVNTPRSITAAAGSTVYIQVRAWTAASGASYEEALSSSVPGTKVGKSNFFAMTSGDGTSFPPNVPNLVGLQSFAITDTAVWPIMATATAATCPTDTTPSSGPYPGMVHINWTPSSNPSITRYRVYRELNGNRTLISDLPKGCPGVSDGPFAFNSAEHNYSVAAVTASGTEEVISPVTSAQIPDFCRPVNLTATPGSCQTYNPDQVTLTWKRPVEGVTSYQIYRTFSPWDQFYILVGTVPQKYTYIPDNTFIDKSISTADYGSTIYSYKVVAQYGGTITESLDKGPLPRPVSYTHTGVGDSGASSAQAVVGVTVPRTCAWQGQTYSFPPPTNLQLKQIPERCALSDPYEQSLANEVALSWDWPIDWSSSENPNPSGLTGLVGYHITRTDLGTGASTSFDVPPIKRYIVDPAIDPVHATPPYGWFGDRTAEFSKSYRYDVLARYSYPYNGVSAPISTTINTIEPCS